MLLLSTSDESEAFCGCCVQLQSDLCGCLPSKRLLILLSRDDLLCEFTQLLNVLAGIDLPEGCFKMESLLHRLKNSFYAPDKLNIAIGSGSSNNLSTRLTKFMSDLEENIGRLIRKYNGDVLLFDTIFESGNLLRADRITP